MINALLFMVRRSALRGAVGFAALKGERFALVFGFLLALPFTSSPLLARIWTDSSGTHRTEADLVKVLNESVRLRTPDGRDIEVPIAKLSAQDQKFVEGERMKQDRAEAQPTTADERIDLPKQQVKIESEKGKEDPSNTDREKTDPASTSQKSAERVNTEVDPQPTISTLFDALGLFVLYGTVVGGVALLVRKVMLLRHARSEKIKSALAQIETSRNELRRILEEKFLVQPCSRCHEFSMQFLEISPNARSVHYLCLHCGKKSRAAAISPESSEFFNLSNRLSDAVCVYNSISESPIAESPIEFRTAPAPMPYEQTHRSPISEAVRSEVWRRDQGSCVKCNSNENLHFDHIIPVARGGATSVRNLQLLCQRCNQAKGARI
jgi:hypothetical protein